MKMKLTLVLLLFLSVGVLARSAALTSAEGPGGLTELNERFMRSASGESTEVAAGEPPGKSREGDLKTVSKEGELLEKPHEGSLEAVSQEGEPPKKSREGDLKTESKEAGINGSGMSGENESESSSGSKDKAKSVESGGEDKRRGRGSSEENKGGSKESSQSGGESKESCEDGGQLSGGGNGDQDTSILHYLTPILDMNGVSQITDLIGKYYSGSLPVSTEALLKTLGITSSLEELKNSSGLYQTMKKIPIVGTIVNFMTNSLSIPINIIALIYSVGTTILQHMYNSLPSIF